MKALLKTDNTHQFVGRNEHTPLRRPQIISASYNPIFASQNKTKKQTTWVADAFVFTQVRVGILLLGKHFVTYIPYQLQIPTPKLKGDHL